LCDFDTDPCPIIKTDGTPLFTDEEIEMIEDYHNANVDLVKAKTTSKRAEAESRKTELAPQIRPLYGKAVEYIKTYAIDPVSECGYTPWDADLTARVNAWIEQTLKMEDAVDTAAPAENKEQPANPAQKAYANTEAFTAPASVIENDDLPF
jgi:hypothetical protein